MMTPAEFSRSDDSGYSGCAWRSLINQQNENENEMNLLLPEMLGSCQILPNAGRSFQHLLQQPCLAPPSAALSKSCKEAYCAQQQQDLQKILASTHDITSGSGLPDIGSADMMMPGLSPASNDTALQLLQQAHPIEACMDLSSLSSIDQTNDLQGNQIVQQTIHVPRKRKKRSRVPKNSEEVESQRMTHIAVERNRRKQMNEHLCMLRSLIPGSYIQKGDQASIVGGTIEFVKELELFLESLTQAHRNRQESCRHKQISSPGCSTTHHHGSVKAKAEAEAEAEEEEEEEEGSLTARSSVAELEVEVTMNGDQKTAIIKVAAQRQPRGHLLAIISALEKLCLKILHLNISTTHDRALFLFHVKIEAECQLKSVSELALSCQQIFTMMLFMET